MKRLERNAVCINEYSKDINVRSTYASIVAAKFHPGHSINGQRYSKGDGSL